MTDTYYLLDESVRKNKEDGYAKALLRLQEITNLKRNWCFGREDVFFLIRLQKGKVVYGI